ncbi:hypothetical protein CC2G_004606 [Coprinopsis cinerea AmutBmut pab1-1]|nr:hypothetical protein CC2G_004606 [Coprinopsis cinerea AmutBmut pab1-1]
MVSLSDLGCHVSLLKLPSWLLDFGEEMSVIQGWVPSNNCQIRAPNRDTPGSIRDLLLSDASKIEHVPAGINLR